MPIHTIMYHFVRNNGEFPYKVHTRNKSEFIKQIQFFKTLYPIISPSNRNEIDYFLNSNEHAILLTFDDGYKDHLWCSEELTKYGLSAIFFPVLNVFNGLILDVNLIHILLGSDIFHDEIIERISFEIKKRNLKINSNKFHYKGNNVKEYINLSREDKNYMFEENKVIAIKRLLQRDIVGLKNRSEIIRKLIKDLTKYNLKEIYDGLYLNVDDMLHMYSANHKFGSHSMTHQWFENLKSEELIYEIKESFDELRNLNIYKKYDLKFLSYPYGSYNNKCMEEAAKSKVDYAFTIEKETKINKKFKNLNLNRWDTNHWWDNEKNLPCKPPLLKF